MIYNVKDFGCKADAKTLDSPAIQAAIDCCTQNGGGKVMIPPGQYLVGKMELKDHVTVEIMEGAVLFASPNREDYPSSPGFPGSLYNQGVDLADSRAERIAMFYACDAKNIGIIGHGHLDGQYEHFLVKNARIDDSPRWISRDQNLDRYYASGPDFKFRILMVYFENCEDIVLDGVIYQNAPCYTIQMRSSSQIQISNVVIRNYLMADNADGIHFSSCSDVRISNCDLECGDDCIAIDSNDMRPSRYFAIQNCRFISRNNCFRIFTNLSENDDKRRLVGYGEVSDIVINNCIVKDASSFVYLNADCGELRRISVSNASGVIERLGTTFLITAHNAKVEQVTFSNFNFLSRGVGYIYADRPNSISGICMENINIQVNPTTQLYGNGLHIPTWENGRPVYWLSHIVPYFLQIVEAEHVTLRNLRVTWGETDIDDIGDIDNCNIQYWPDVVAKVPHWPAIWAENTNYLVLDNIDAESFGQHPCTIQLDCVKNAMIKDSFLPKCEIAISDDCENIIM